MQSWLMQFLTILFSKMQGTVNQCIYLPGVHPTFDSGRALGKHRRVAMEGVQLVAKGEYFAEHKVCNLDVHGSIQEKVLCS